MKLKIILGITFQLIVVIRSESGTFRIRISDQTLQTYNSVLILKSKLKHWDQHWNIKKIDINIDIEYMFDVLIFYIDIELNLMFKDQSIDKVLNIFNTSMHWNVT